MGKDAYYFSHDSNARHDPKISALINQCGIEGYGRFWIVVEMLREQAEYKLPIKKYIFNALAMQMQCDAQEAENFIKSCINEFELFDSDGEFFWSNSLIERMEKKEERSRKASNAAKKRWNKNEENANAMLEQCDSNAIKGKERKVKESKISTFAHAENFESFWNAYPKKKSKGQAEKAFVKINPDEQLLATMLAKIEQAKTSKDWTEENGRYIPYPASWLNAKGWEDEEVPITSTDHGRYDGQDNSDVKVEYLKRLYDN